MNELLAPRLEVTALTVVVVMRETEGSILLAADQQFLSGNFRDLHIKLRGRTIKNQHIAWSSSGNPGIGLDEFGEWVSTYDFSDKSSRSFIDEATECLSRLNGKRRKMARLSDEAVTENMLAEVLIAGWLGGELFAYILSNAGGCDNVLQYNFGAIGSGRIHAQVARRALSLCQSDLNTLDALKIVMGSVAYHVADCREPIDIWRINKDGVEDIMKKENDKEKGIFRWQIHDILDKASKPIKKSEKGKS